MPGDTDDIVVTARLNLPQNGAYNNVAYEMVSNSSFAGDQASPSEDTSTQMAGVVNVHVSSTDSTVTAAAQKAATRLAQTIAVLRDLLGHLPGNQVLSYRGGSVTVSSVLNTINNTNYIITDENFTRTNGGVGAAIASSNGPNTDKFNYQGFLGYASYSDDTFHLEGAMAIVLHEIAHLLPDGINWLSDAQNNYKKDYGNLTNFYLENPGDSDDYYHSEEMFMNDVAQGIASSANIPFDSTRLPYGYEAEAPTEIYEDHHEE